VRELTRSDLIKITVLAINETMDKNQRTKRNFWTYEPPENHIKEALSHLSDMDGMLWTDKELKDHLVKAITRLAMAITVLYKDDYKERLIGGNKVAVGEIVL